MKKESDGKYSYTFKTDWDNPLIIFNDGDARTASSTRAGTRKGSRSRLKKYIK